MFTTELHDYDFFLGYSLHFVSDWIVDFRGVFAVHSVDSKCVAYEPSHTPLALSNVLCYVFDDWRFPFGNHPTFRTQCKGFHMYYNWYVLRKCSNLWCFFVQHNVNKTIANVIFAKLIYNHDKK